MCTEQGEPQGTAVAAPSMHGHPAAQTLAGGRGWSPWSLQPPAALPSPLLAFLHMAGAGKGREICPGDSLLAQTDRGAGAAAGRLSHPQQAAVGTAEVPPPPMSPAWCWRLHFQEHFELLSLRITKCQSCTNGLCGARQSAVPPQTRLCHRHRKAGTGFVPQHRESRYQPPQPGLSHCSHTPELPHREQEPRAGWRHGLGKSRSLASTTLV